jgi:hypothetical protein
MIRRHMLRFIIPRIKGQRLHSLTSWRPRRTPRDVLADLLDWSAAHEDSLRAALGFER